MLRKEIEPERPVHVVLNWFGELKRQEVFCSIV